MIMRRPYSRTATRRDHLAEGPRNTQVTAERVKEQAKGLNVTFMPFGWWPWGAKPHSHACRAGLGARWSGLRAAAGTAVMNATATAATRVAATAMTAAGDHH